MSKHISSIHYIRYEIYGLLSKYISHRLNIRILSILMNICNTYVSDTYIFSDLGPLSKPIYRSRQ